MSFRLIRFKHLGNHPKRHSILGAAVSQVHLKRIKDGLAVKPWMEDLQYSFKVHIHTPRVSLVQQKLQELQSSHLWPLPVVSFKCCGMEITQNDLDTLLPGKWLNDQVFSTAYTCTYSSTHTIPLMVYLCMIPLRMTLRI